MILHPFTLQNTTKVTKAICLPTEWGSHNDNKEPVYLGMKTLDRKLGNVFDEYKLHK